MCFRGSVLRNAMGGFLIAALAMPAVAADPLTLILLRLLRDQMITSVATSTVEGIVDGQKPGASIAPPQHSKPQRPYGMGDEQVRRLIDEGFVHLTQQQRDEVYASVKHIIDDPRNAPQVPSILAELAIKASSVRQAHEQLSGLSENDKRTVATRARAEYEKMQPEERAQMLRVLRLRLAPLPAGLNEMILAEFAKPLPQEQSPETAQP
jgi:hypothetical protein